ncbi:RecX family transcriptional regulator [Bacillus coahuilensis]|uniref:RecX family transcriptional regulator n=1 Tax=Bacillus coahuilensis TaxID=408580 RepID=UPI0001850B4A|nr:RecX family transcriptional regulator [Bacillus coahuilensis]
MGMISKITTQKRNTERYNLFINGKYAFSVDESVLTRFQLRKGLEIDEEDIHKIQQQDDIRKAINAAVHYLSFRMRSFKEIHDHLKEKEYEEVVIASAMEKIQELGYVNDLEFAIAYSNTQRATTDKGPIRIKQELRERGSATPLSNK